MNDDVVERLDTLIGLFRLAHAEDISRATAKVKSDPVVAAILELSVDWVGAGSVKSQVARDASTSEKTVQRRIAELVESGFLKADGAAVSRRIKSTGLV